MRIKGKVLYLQNQKLVPMKKEIGKWLMDIAKYITTAVLLSAVFRDMESPWVVIGGISGCNGHTRMGGFTSYVTIKRVINLIRNVNDMGAIAVYIFCLIGSQRGWSLLLFRR